MAAEQRQEMHMMNIAVMVLIVVLCRTEVVSQSTPQEASYHCQRNTDGTRIDFTFRLEKNDDTVSFIHMYEGTKATGFVRSTDEATGLDCGADISSDNVGELIVTFNPSLALPCKMDKTGDIVTAVFRTEEVGGADTADDQFYRCTCDVTAALENEVDTGIDLGPIHEVVLNHTRSAVLEIYDTTPTLVSESTVLDLGDSITFRVTYTRDKAIEKIFPLAAFVDEFQIATMFDFSDAVTLISSGCPTTAGKILAGSGFDKFSKDSSLSSGDDWVLDTPTIGAFSIEDDAVGTRMNFFRAKLGYCFQSSNTECGTSGPTCPGRKKREMEDEITIDNDFIQTYIVVRIPDTEVKTEPSDEPHCAKSSGFAIVLTSLILMLLTEIAVTSVMSYKLISRHRNV